MYLRALAALSEGPGGVTVRSGLLAAMINQLINVDVEIKWQDIVDAMGEAPASWSSPFPAYQFMLPKF